jgi:hypothetical protein
VVALALNGPSWDTRSAFTVLHTHGAYTLGAPYTRCSIHNEALRASTGARLPLADATLALRTSSMPPTLSAETSGRQRTVVHGCG